ncbi:DUF3515 family protein [Yimella sp. cx-51]|uniref:DUF3515 family protein n=1 Tax=Yimella sp. cx-51 TaxID=2770551 RepID=UPI001FCB0B3D|nr:DUF3515 family protein [Yimella sp. cx-51]
MHRRQGLIAAAVAIGALVTGCGSDVVSVTPADGHADPLCSKAGAHWPDTVASQAKQAVSTAGKTEAAWGDPAIIARCGVSMPSPSEDCISANGVDWVMHELSDGKSFVTYGRLPAIQVLVPKDYAPEPMVLGAFSAAAKQIPQGQHRCS